MGPERERAGLNHSGWGLEQGGVQLRSDWEDRQMSGGRGSKESGRGFKSSGHKDNS